MDAALSAGMDGIRFESSEAMKHLKVFDCHVQGGNG